MKVISKLLIATVLFLPVTGLHGQVAAEPAVDVRSPTIQSLVQDIPRGFLAIENSSRDFFQAGMVRQEREIQILNQQRLFSDDSLLTIHEDLPRFPEEQWQFESPERLLKNVSPSHVETFN
ncbi:MAG: hypothetical protein F6K19_31645 [Cyanothece sp. SIO1E1]|nr:hypothetical protein [Cyanothece sp. SIO1E1]